MSRGFSETTMATIEPHLPVAPPGGGMAATNIWKRVRMWARPTVWFYLEELVRLGVAVCEKGTNGQATRYRRAP